MLFRSCGAVALLLAADVAGARHLAAQNTAPNATNAVQVRGVVFDSLRRRPLADAVISIVGGTRSTRADARGRFVFDRVAPGVYTFAAQHAALDSLGFSGISARATVSDGRDEVRIGTPSFATLWRAACGSTNPPADSGFVYGSVRDAATAGPVPNAVVDVTWLDLGVTKARRITQIPWRGRTLTDSTGSYGICGIPIDVGLRIRAATDSAASGLIDLPARGARVQRRDLVLGPAAGDSAPGGRGVIAGVVADSAGQPVADARVITDGAPELRSGTNGRFIVPNVPLGSRQVEVLAIGMAPVITVVDVTASDTASVFASMRKVTTLDVVRVTASANVRRLVRELEDRRKLGAGHMRDSTEIAAHGTLFSVFQQFPGVQIIGRGGANAFTISLPGIGSRRCLANVIIDGNRSDHEQLSFLRPADIAVLEVYARKMSLPMQFVRNDDCGAVIVWTKWGFT